MNKISDFEKYVEKKETGCLEWTGSLWATGYGRAQYKNKSWKAHRLMYWHYTGTEVPKEICLLHRCDNRLCVNPEHMFFGTRADNNKDKTQKGRQYSRISKAQAIDIKKSSLDAGFLAELHGVTIGHIRKIRSGWAWNHA